MKKMNKMGFTLIELMIVVAIIGILAVVAVPKFADLINKSKEGATKGSLGAMRAALTVYYGDQEGQYPYDTLASLAPKYLESIPLAKTPPAHTTDSSGVVAGTSAAYVTDANGWAYNNTYTETTGAGGWGTVVVNCTHTNSKGERWTAIGL